MKTREEWLNACADRLARDILGPVGLDSNAETGEPVVDALRIGVGWPSQRALSKRTRVVGQCWSQEVSDDGTTEIVISLYLDNPVEVAATLLHEMLHSSVGHAAKHDLPFKRACRQVGLAGPAKQTIAGPTLQGQLEAITAELGEYPHHKLDVSKLPKQPTRLLKAVCEARSCPSQEKGGYVVRITALWAKQAAPLCGLCGNRLTVKGLGA